MESASHVERSLEPCTQIAYAVPDDWEQHREKIGALYRDNTLSTVMRMMEGKFEFRATMKMYKDRLARWNMGKYKRRLSPGRRRRKVQNRQRASPSSLEVQTLTGQSLKETTAPSDLHDLAHPDLDHCQRIFGLTSAYFLGSIESKTWTFKRKGFHSCKANPNDAQLLERFYQYANTAVAEKAGREMEHLLIIALAPLGRLIRVESPFLIVNFLRIAMKAHVSGNTPLITPIFGHLHAMSKTIHGDSHPISQLCLWVAQIGGTAQRDVLQRCLACIVDVVQRRAGNRHNSIMRIRKYLLAFDIYNNNATLTLEEVEEAESAYGKTDSRTLCLKKKYIQSLLQERSRNRWQDATDLGLRTLAAVNTSQARVFVGWQSIFCALLSDVYHMLRSPLEAGEYLHQSIELGEKAFGKYHPRVLLRLEQLESRLTEYGRPADALDVREQRVSRINSVLHQTMI